MQVLFGILMLLFVLKKRPDLLKIDIKQVLRFTLSATLIFSVQALYVAYLGKDTYLDRVYLDGINSLAGVWWEDACFVLPYLLLSSYLGKKSYILFPLFVASSAFFSMGHAYQGPGGYVTFIFPFVSYFYAKKYGAGTTMLCHILYDVTLVVCMSGLKNLLIGVL